MRQLARVIVALVCLALPALAHAQDSPAERAMALADTALMQFGANDHAAALATFRQAEGLFHSPVFVLYIARSQRALNQLLAARDGYKQVLDEELPSGAPEPWQLAQTDAKREHAELVATIPTVTITVELAAGEPTVTIDGQPAVTNAAVELDPGTHRVEARAGENSDGRDFELTAGARITVHLKLGTSAPPSPDPLPGPAPVENEPRGLSGMVLGGALAIGAGIVGLAVVGPVTGALALSSADEARAGCNEETKVCPAGNDLFRDTAKTMAHVSTAAFAIGGAALVLGIVLVAVGAGDDADSALVVEDGRIGFRF